MANFYKIKYSGKQLEELLDQIYDIPYSSGDGIILAETQIQANVTTMLYSDGLYYWYINGDKTNIVNPDGEGATAPTATIGENGFWYLNGQQTNLLVPSGKSISLDPNYAKFTNYLTTEKVNEQLEPILTDIANLKVTKQDSLIAGDWITIQNNTISTSVDIPTQISDLPNDANYVNLNEVKNYVDPIDETLRSDIASHGTRLSTLENAIQNKVDKVDGKGLSTNDFTTEYKTQLDDLSTTYATKQDLTDIINGAPEEYDTLKEIAEWIKSDESGSAAMTSDIATLKSYFTDGSANKALADQSGNNIETTYAKISDFNALNAEVETKQDTLVSGTNVKTVNGQSILGSGNIEINGSNFKIIDLTSETKYKTINSIYTFIFNQKDFTFDNQSSIYNNIATAINSGLIPVLKFNDGYGYYRNFIASSNEYIFIMNYIEPTSGNDYPANNLITLQIGNSTNNGYSNNLSQIPYTIIVQNAFSDNGNINDIDQMLLIAKGITYTGYNKIGGLFLYNVAEKQLYNIYSLNPSVSGSNAILEAYAIINNKIVCIKFTAGQSGGYDYTKTTYALGGGGDSNTIVIDLGTFTEMSGTISPTILSEINSAISENKNIVIKANVGIDIIFPNVMYEAGAALYATGFTYDNPDLTAGNILINLSNGQYNLAEFGIQEKLVSGTNIKTINNQSILGSGNIAVQEPLVSGTNIKTVNNQSLLGAGNIDISGGSASKMVNLGTLSNSGTLEADKLQELMTLFQNGDLIQATFVLNNAQFITASAYSNGSSMGIVAHAVVAEFDAAAIADVSINMANGNYTITPFAIPASFKTINDSSLIGNGNINLQEPLVSGSNIKTVNGQSLLGSGNIEIDGSKFQIIDVTKDTLNNSISMIYGSILSSFSFSNQSEIYNNIATAISNGLIPILKFADGYGYYKAYVPLNSGEYEYVFILNYTITAQSINNPINYIITLKVGNTQNNGYRSNLSQIPSTVVISSGAFGDSGSLSYAETQYLKEALNNAQGNSSAGIFILNNTDNNIYHVISMQTSPSPSLIAYTITQGSVELLNLTISEMRTYYTKTTYALGGGGGESNSITIDLGTLSSTGGTLSSEILAQINNNLENKSITFEGNISGISITTATYFVSANMIIISALASSTIHNLTIKLTDGRYETSQVILLDSVDTKTINNISLLGAGNIAVQEPLVSGTNIKTVNGNSLLGSGNIELSDDTVVIDLGTLEGESGTLSPTILSEINNAISGNKHFVLKVNVGFDVIFPNVLYSEGANLYATGFMYSITELTAGNILIDLSNGQYMLGNFEIQEKLVSGTNIKTINNQSILGSGDLQIAAGSAYATDDDVNNLFTNPGQPIPERTISLENLNAFKQQIDNEIGKVLEEGF